MPVFYFFALCIATACNPLVQEQPKTDSDYSPGVKSSKLTATTLSTITGTTSITADGSTASTITITLKASGSVPVPGVVPTFSASGTGNTVSVCTASSATGVSTCSLTSTVAETKTLSIVTPVAVAGGSVTFIPGAVSAAGSTASISVSSVSHGGGTATVSLVARDANGNALGANIAPAVTFVLDASGGAGTSNGNFGAVTGVAGTYTSTFTGTATGTARIINCYIGGVLIGTTLPTITVTNTAPSLTAPTTSNAVYPLSSTNPPLIQGTAYTFTVGASDVDSDTVSLNSCTYQTVDLPNTDPNYAASGTACTSLPSVIITNSTPNKSVVAVNNAARTIAWTPTSTQRGTYKFSVTGTDGTATSATTSFYVTVRGAYNTSNLLAAFESKNAVSATGLSSSVPSAPLANGAATGSTWLDLAGGTFSSLLTGITSANPWAGTGASTSPYSFAFNGTNDVMNFGTIMSGKTTTAFSAWVKPTSVSTAGSLILANGDANSAGFRVRQSLDGQGSLDFGIGAKNYSTTIVGDAPSAYWRLGEAAGNNTASDTSGANYCAAAACNGTYQNAPTRGSGGGITTDSDTSVAFNGTNNYISTPSLTLALNVSVEYWFKTTGAGQSAAVSNRNGGAGVTYIGKTGGKAFIFTGSSVTSVATITDGAWHHFVWTNDGTTTNLYLDGALDKTAAQARVANTDVITIGRDTANGEYWNGSLDEVAIYSSVLSLAQVQSHYRAGISCRGSNTSWANGVWAHIAGLFDGTTTSLYLNGVQLCSVSQGGTFSPAANNLYVGASSTASNAWAGSISDIKVYGTGAAAPASAATLRNDFAMTANEYRAVPVEDIATNGLVFHLDAANAKYGQSSYAAGCAGTDLTWWDLISGNLGTLTNFGTCGTYAWQGTGSVAAPYRIVMDGAATYVPFSSITLPGIATIEAWIKTSTALQRPLVSLRSGGNTYFGVTTGKIFNFNGVNSTGNTNVNDGNWHHIAWTNDGTNSYLYKDAVLDKTTADTTGAQTGTVQIGKDTPNGEYFPGETAIVRIYNRQLSVNELKQNCNAQQARFSGAAICAAP